MKKLIAVLLALITLMCSMSIGAYAAVSHDDEVAPCYNNTATSSVVLTINSSGLATIRLTCTGISNVTTKVVAETKLERKWGIFWTDVAEWTDTVNATFMSKTHTKQLTKTGTYRAKTKYTVYGSGGSADVINMEAKYTY